MEKLIDGKRETTFPVCSISLDFYAKKDKGQAKKSYITPTKGFCIYTKEKGCSIQLTMVTDDYVRIDHQARLLSQKLVNNRLPQIVSSQPPVVRLICF